MFKFNIKLADQKPYKKKLLDFIKKYEKPKSTLKRSQEL